MNNEEFRKLKSRIAIMAVIKIIFFSLVSILILIFLIDGVLEDFLAETVNAISMRAYYYFKANKVLFMGIFYAISCSIVSFFVIRNTSESLVLLIKSMDKILNNPQDEISLPNDLNLLERRLNNIRVDLITSRNNEKEAINKKNDLIMYMAHDLKTPLTSVIGYLSLLSNEEEISKETRDKYINIALDKAYRLEELTNQFFEITRYNLQEMPIVKSKIDLSLLLNQLVDECYPMMQDKNLSVNLDTYSVIINADGDKLARAFTNLLKNAINYSYEDSVIEVSSCSSDEEVVITFKNQGEKIPEYKLEKIFEKFYRADESRASSTGGTGLGLAITKDIITLHGGSISVSSDDEYIVFKVILPKISD